MLPAFDDEGNLPPGVHWADWPEIEHRFGQNPHRVKLLEGFRVAIEELRAAGCKTVYLDGSFVTEKAQPNDFDACWDLADVDPDKLDPVFLDFDNSRATQKARFLGEFFPAQFSEGVSGKTFLDFFQIDKQTGNLEGIIGLNL
jgi:hypothetical protein